MATFSLLHAALLFWVALAAAQGSDLKALKHKGCYWSRPTNFAIGGFSKTDSQRQKCLDTCTRRGQQWIAFGSVNCLCGKTAPRYHQVDNNRCNAQCVGILDGDCIKQPRNNYALGEDDELYAVFSVPSIATELLSSERTSPKHTEPNGHPGQACYSKVPTTITQLFARNSPMLCHRFCQQRGRMYAFTRDQTCYCSNEYPDKKDELPDSQCNVQCPGTNLFNCGGYNVAFSVYNLGPERKPITEPKPIRQIERCFYDIPMTASRIPLDAGAVSRLPSSCIDSCKAAGKGVAFIKGSQCHCAQGYPRSSSTTDLRECQIPCAGDSKYSCGGYGVTADTFSAYRTGYAGARYRIQQESNNKDHMQKPAQEPRLGRVTSHGCYNMQSATLTHKKLESMNSVDQCARYCQREDKPVAAVQRGWCLCSDTYPAKSARVDDSQCASWCPGWSREACGGRRTWSVVNTGITTDVMDDELKTEEVELPAKIPNRPTEMGLSKLKPHGCFSLPDFTSSYPPRVNIRGPFRSSNGDSCNRQCTIKGYSVALRHGSRCFCSNKLPEESARVADDKCWFTSIFDTREQCGGPDDAYSVYRLGSDSSDTEENDVARGDNPSNSPVKRPQCLHHGVERIYEISSWAITKVGEFAQNARDGLAGFLDKAQDIFDACLWKLMVTFSDIMYSLGWRSSSGDVDL